MQNAEEWNLDFYLMDLADEIARHAFNTGRYPEINYITGNADKDTPTETNQDGSLNIYVPQNIDQQQFQQALNAYIKNGSVVMYQQSQCGIQVVPCSYEKEEAQKQIQAFNAARDTEYYRLINGPNNSLYIMKCEAQTQEIKEQIQRQFENSNGYYYSQTNTYTPNSYESNSKESKYITALKMFYLTGIMPQRLPQPDQDDEEQQKLYYVCQYLSSYASQVHYNFCYNIMLNKFKNKQAYLDDEFKKCGIEIYDLYDRSASQINQQSLLPIQVSPVPVSQVLYTTVPPPMLGQPLEIYDPGSGLTSTSAVSPYGNPIYSQPPVEAVNPYDSAAMQLPSMTVNKYPQPVSAIKPTTISNAANNPKQQLFSNADEFEDFGTIQIQQISGNSADNAKLKVTCKDKNGKEFRLDVNNVTDVLLKDVINIWADVLDIPNDGSNSLYCELSSTWVDLNALLYHLKDKTINVKRKKRLAEIGNNTFINQNINNVNNNNLGAITIINDHNNANNNKSGFGNGMGYDTAFKNIDNRRLPSEIIVAKTLNSLQG